MENYSAPFGEAPVYADEEELIGKIIDANAMMMKDVDGRKDRAQHPKAHGLVDATMQVADGIPENLAVGLFAQPKAFDVKIRYSNGTSYNDTKADAHGMAIKIAGVPGEKLTDEPVGDDTADIILMDAEVFFEGDLKRYTAFNDFVGELVDYKRNHRHTLEAIARFMYIKMMQFLKEPIMHGDFSRAEAISDQPPRSPIDITYYSAVPYLLGDTAIKYEARPGPGAESPKIVGEDGMFTALDQELSKGPATYELMAMLQPDWQTHPVDDPTRSWDKNADGQPAPAIRVKLATITIPQIAAGTLKESLPFARAISFNPWNTLAENRPLGAINRARKIVYKKLSAMRTH